jgi:hypothetical protein
MSNVVAPTTMDCNYPEFADRMGLSDSYIVNEPCIVNMRCCWYETERSRGGSGISPSAGRTVDPGGQEQWRGSGNRWHVRVFGEGTLQDAREIVPAGYRRVARERTAKK